MTDPELNRLFAEEVAGWELRLEDGLMWSAELREARFVPGSKLHKARIECCGEDSCGPNNMIPDYCNDANVMTGLIEIKGQNVDACFTNRPTGGLWNVFVKWPLDHCFEATAPTFAKAAVLALLKAHGVEVAGE